MAMERCPEKSLPLRCLSETIGPGLGSWVLLMWRFDSFFQFFELPLLCPLDSQNLLQLHLQGLQLYFHGF